jgi:hypothetical protein
MEIKAVEFMREIRKKLEQKYSGLSFKKKMERTNKEIEQNPIWKDFLTKHHILPH